MKNVRLFAVAAALGMFASTVAAAEPTKTVTWSDVDSVIKVDLGEALVATAPTATVTLSEEKVETGSIYAVSPIANEDGWTYANNMYWTSPSDALATLALGSKDNLYGTRFLKPGQTGVDEDDPIYVNQKTGKVYGNIDEAFAGLETDGIIEVVYNEDKEIVEVHYDLQTNYYADGKTVNSRQYSKLSSTNARKSDDNIKEAIVKYVANGTAMTPNGFTLDGTFKVLTGRTTSLPTLSVYEDDLTAANKVTVDLDAVTGGAQGIDALNTYTKGSIVVVDRNKKGQYSYVAAALGESKYSYKAAGTTGTASTADRKGNVLYTVAAGTGTLLTSDAALVSAVEDSKTIYKLDTTPAVTTNGAHSYAVGDYLNTADNSVTSVTTADQGLSDGVNTYFKLLTATRGSDYTYTEGDAGTQVSVSAKNLVAGVTYVSGADGTKEFTSDMITYLDDADDANFKPLNSDYVIAQQAVADETVYDAVAYFTKDFAGNESYVVATWEDGNIEVDVNGKLVKIDTKKKAASYLTKENLDNVYVNGTKISTITKDVDHTYGNLVGYAGLFKNEYDFTSTDASGVATHVYNKAAKATAKNYAWGTVDSKVAPIATLCYVAEKNTNTKYNFLTKLAKPGYVTIVDISDVEKEDLPATLNGVTLGGTGTAGSATLFDGSTVVERYAVAFDEDYKFEKQYAVLIDGETVSFVEANLESAGDATTQYSVLTAGDTTDYIYEVKDINDNDSEYYVLTNAGGLNFTFSHSSKGVGTLEGADGEDFDCLAVELGTKKNTKWYPAFKTEEELIEAVYKLTGLDKALVGTSVAKTSANTSFFKWYTEAVKVNDGKDVDGNDLPTEAAVKENKKVDSSSTDVVVTSNKDEIDTSVAGVKELTYTATYKDEVVGTKTVTVVVAPKYTRTWENGRVKTLKSYYVSNPSQVYADYTYDWAGKTVTYTYYNVDGSVASQGTNKLD